MAQQTATKSFGLTVNPSTPATPAPAGAQPPVTAEPVATPPTPSDSTSTT
jgi:hypothetical protein